MKRVKYFLLLVFAISLFSCKTEKLETPSEPVKDITGNWQVVQVTRNGTDLTRRFDFSNFRIKFSDTSYTLTNLIPFLVNKNGTWRFDDPQYPFRLSLIAKDSSAKVSSLLYPIVGGKRNMVLSISPGCTKNIYQYTLQKVD